MVIGLSGIMVYGAQLEFICEKRDADVEAFGLLPPNSTCLPFVNSGEGYGITVCHKCLCQMKISTQSKALWEGRC